MGRFSEAISEGDGISVIPILSGDVATLAALAEEARAEALAVRAIDDVARARSSTGLPIITRELIEAGERLRAVESAQADACCLVVSQVENGDLLENLYAQAAELGLECALDVRDEEELEAALERVDPEILILSERDVVDDVESLERTFELLVDVPAGKLVISESQISTRAQVLALEEAGVDALILSNTPEAEHFASVIAELSGPEPPSV